ncbi:hypothetical protein EYF80_003782 [Liparis tanakae]|uniref:Uncharacterized protein n=1 Tax=Liparis tanakae TaxID=230148 RepID=A0A4Z2J8A4_9TELE|nr:hypothetical protein EYF80_003782 [Liparis tanakae]
MHVKAGGGAGTGLWGAAGRPQRCLGERVFQSLGGEPVFCECRWLALTQHFFPPTAQHGP